MRPLFALLLVGSGSVAAAPVPKELRKPDDKNLIVGTWKPVSPKAGWFQFAADGTLQTWNDPLRSSEQAWTWEVVDQKATPKRAKITLVKGRSFECVYELDGDALKFALIMYPQKGVPANVEEHPALQFFDLTRDKAGK